MVRKKDQSMKTIMKPVSLYKEDIQIINNELDTFGEFSQYVRFCLKDQKQIDKFKQLEE